MKATIKKSSVLLLFFFFLTDNCWWLVNARMRSLAVELCWIIILIIFFIMLARRNCGELFNKNKYYYGKNILFYLVMGIYSSVQANLLYGQSLSEGLIPQRDIMCGFLFYFVIMNYIHMKDSGLHQIKHIFLIVGYIELILYISQYVLINDFSFLQVNYSYRLGDVRLNLNAMVIPYVIFSSVNNVYKNEKWKIKDFLAIAGGLFYVFQITKTRIALVAYFIAIVGGYVLWKKGGKKKAVVWIGLLILGFYIIQTPLFSFLMEGINNGDPSAQARELGRSVYISKILEHPIFGCGYINTNNAAAVSYAAMNEGPYGGIYWVDLGVYGVTFFFGIVGLVWLVWLFAKMIFKSFILALNGNITYFMYMLYLIVLLPNGTGFMWYFINTVGFIIILCFIEADSMRIRRRNHSYEAI